ncbi:P-type conjugative transfer protein VirB9 [Enterobacter quasiroggenkampii]|uniref:P-type conjugative transfer protein VirB9 n=1 Tax=Enterobacter quasiroggenkampii TaxID=2497436 RepID=UPI0021D342AF|nr:P-type conjugative transfer protein VirB9 [Enterobacter quasiroggenkampii]MCU6278882.1 P-type conjugative transfer protein VirB9 [Enterobacter quasiroggenkampii]
MKLKKSLLLLLAVTSSTTWAAITPRSSSYDSHMQNVSYNSQNSTVVNARSGYVTTLIFDDDETVIEADAGFENGWSVTKSANRVKIRPSPITQPVTDADGTTKKQVFLPTSKDWKTNLFVTTSKRYYSLILNVIDDDKPSDGLAFVVRYQYPDDMRKQSETARLAREKELQEVQDKERIELAFKNATTPRNWNYTKRVATGSENIAPDFAYDDGRFTYLGFSPQKAIPSPFVLVNGAEQVVTPTFSTQGNYKVMIVRSLSPRFVLRYGNAVVGIENAGFGQVAVANGDTVSSKVELELK